jgi:hypothetical protein
MKKWISRILRSKVMMFNAFISAMAALEGVYTVLQPFVDGNVFAYLTVILTVGNAALRPFTNIPLRDK